MIFVSYDSFILKYDLFISTGFFHIIYLFWHVISSHDSFCFHKIFLYNSFILTHDSFIFSWFVSKDSFISNRFFSPSLFSPFFCHMIYFLHVRVFFSYDSFIFTWFFLSLFIYFDTWFISIEMILSHDSFLTPFIYLLMIFLTEFIYFHVFFVTHIYGMTCCNALLYVITRYSQNTMWNACGFFKRINSLCSLSPRISLLLRTVATLESDILIGLLFCGFFLEEKKVKKKIFFLKQCFCLHSAS